MCAGTANLTDKFTLDSCCGVSVEFPSATGVGDIELCLGIWRFDMLANAKFEHLSQLMALELDAYLSSIKLSFQRQEKYVSVTLNKYKPLKNL